MSGSRISQLKTIIDNHNIEIIVGTLISIPIFLFILFALIENDFSVLDHSYWVGVIAFNAIVIFGVWFTLSNKTLHLSTSILYYTVGLSLILFFLYREFPQQIKKRMKSRSVIARILLRMALTACFRPRRPYCRA